MPLLYRRSTGRRLCIVGFVHCGESEQGEWAAQPVSCREGGEWNWPPRSGWLWRHQVGKYIGLLREVGYKGVLSIEHEDSPFGHKEGFRQGSNYLNQFCNT